METKAVKGTTVGRMKALCVMAIVLVGCEPGNTPPTQTTPPPEAPATPQASAAPPQPEPAEAVAPPMRAPVDVYENGRVVRQMDADAARAAGYVVLDLGESWTPYLFTEASLPGETPKPNAYRATYLALARGEFPRDRHGARARSDQYLELFGIAPTLGLLRKRIETTEGLACASSLDLTPLEGFETDGIGARGNDQARRDASRFQNAEAGLSRVLTRHHVASRAELDPAALTDEERDAIAAWDRFGVRGMAIRSIQARLACEGFFTGLGRPIEGGFDGKTREALARFEKRHRIYGRGFLGRETLSLLRLPPLEADREDLVRVLTERVIHAAGVIEDGSASGTAERPRTFQGRDGQAHPIPNLEEDLRDKTIAAFGIETPASAKAFLAALGALPNDAVKLAALKGPTLPEYYGPDMEFSVEIDRGDVWYDFPYNENGQEMPQPVERRPHLTIFTNYGGQRIPLARFGTTIGGWRSEFIENRVWWKYKNSPAGPVVWSEIVGAPVWVPPESTPPSDLLRRAGRRPGHRYQVNYDEMGPGYASAYGLAVAYHRPYVQRDDGSIAYRADQGIRTHGSVDYTSIMRRHSHGCHRLHNHIAVRLMSFVLAHRPHERRGMDPVHIERTLVHEGEQIPFELKEGGYVFRLARPIAVEVLEGRIQGGQQEPIEIVIPKFDEANGAYVMPDGTAVALRDGALVPVPLPTVLPDGGVPPLRLQGATGLNPIIAPQGPPAPPVAP